MMWELPDKGGDKGQDPCKPENPYGLGIQRQKLWTEGGTCMTIFRMGVEERRSYRAKLRSLAQVASRSGSAALKRTAVRVSAPHEKLATGSDRPWSQMSSCRGMASFCGRGGGGLMLVLAIFVGIDVHWRTPLPPSTPSLRKMRLAASPLLLTLYN